MSLSSKAPGVGPGWRCPGRNGTRRIVKSSKKFLRRLRRRVFKKPPEVES